MSTNVLYDLFKQHGFADADCIEFGRIVVKECIEIINEDTGDSEWNSYNRATVTNVKRHFGVE